MLDISISHITCYIQPQLSKGHTINLSTQGTDLATYQVKLHFTSKYLMHKMSSNAFTLQQIAYFSIISHIMTSGFVCSF